MNCFSFYVLTRCLVSKTLNQIKFVIKDGTGYSIPACLICNNRDNSGMICLQGSNHFKKRQCAKKTYLMGGVEKVLEATIILLCSNEVTFLGFLTCLGCLIFFGDF